jgi:hypothetical protein
MLNTPLHLPEASASAHWPPEMGPPLKPRLFVLTFGVTLLGQIGGQLVVLLFLVIKVIPGQQQGQIDNLYH